MLKEIGVKGQKRIKAAKVVVAGAGALGSPVIQYLAAAGVGTIKVIDFNEVSLENLQSQVLHGSRDIKRPKVASVKDKVKNINKNIELIAEKVQLDSSNILEQIDGYDLVVDCSDNYKARYHLPGERLFTGFCRKTRSRVQQQGSGFCVYAHREPHERFF